ncbi:MAG: signal recognition particle-docking protein FtsY [Methanobrevibacter boviskoreani]|uniref:signal recognition particle-docking protein FtsY n=1 Tax=Methanobrevibacter boviskoreani TaxID=1348249 RepID=UPI000593DD44|nr:signal recognition particle-docking protein FtsY [Methanobrevibacter boviskoreani]MDY5615240.1 signal recognition particle-docking protein FtsY [Methanobrevibacter boviskoreani]
MFESLKKRFSRTSDQLTDKLNEEAKEENNIKVIESAEPSEDLDDFEDLSEEKTIEDKDAEWEAIFDEEDEEIDEDEDNEENSGFLSRFSRHNDDSDKKEKKNEPKRDRFAEALAEQEAKKEAELRGEEYKSNKKHWYSRGSSEEEEPARKPEITGPSTEYKFLDDDEEIKEEKKHWYSRNKEPEVSVNDKYREEVSAKEIYKEIEDEKTHSNEEEHGVFSFIKEKTIDEEDIEDVLWELELGLLEGDVAIDVASEVVESVRRDLVGKKIRRSSDIEEYTYKALKKAIAKIINVGGKSMTEMLNDKKKEGKPLIVMLVGINGTGKTTTIGKLANYYLKRGYTPVIAASDTFRAGAIEQVTQHANNVGVKIIKHQKGSDPAAVAYDAVEHATAQHKDLVLIDTAGRMQTNTNLMDEMKKIKRVAKPDLVVFVGDALTGNDAVEQAKKFNEAIDIDGVILTKADADAKGGASLSIGYVIKKPIYFLGMGQGYDDIKEYNAEWMLDQLFS